MFSSLFFPKAVHTAQLQKFLLRQVLMRQKGPPCFFDKGWPDCSFGLTSSVAGIFIKESSPIYK